MQIHMPMIESQKRPIAGMEATYTSLLRRIVLY